jgi:hypothetical protein
MSSRENAHKKPPEIPRPLDLIEWDEGVEELWCPGCGRESLSGELCGDCRRLISAMNEN